MKIGLTGSIACGKSTVSAYLRELGYPVVDADAISHALTAPGGAALPALAHLLLSQGSAPGRLAAPVLPPPGRLLLLRRALRASVSGFIAVHR